MSPIIKNLKALQFLNALHNKNTDALKACFDPIGSFQDVLPNGTIVKSSSELLKLHVGFIQSASTGFRPFDWEREFNDLNAGHSENREFYHDDLDSMIEFESGYFCRVAAEVDRPIDFNVIDSKVARYYMYLGILVKDEFIVHVQNTLFNPMIQGPS